VLQVVADSWLLMQLFGHANNAAAAKLPAASACMPSCAQLKALLLPTSPPHWEIELRCITRLGLCVFALLLLWLQGLHHPVGRDDFRDELIKFVKDKVSNDNVIILSVMTASLAVAAGDTNLSLAYPLACQADPDFKRTLTIITKADAVHAQDMPAALNAALEKSHTHGCVLVSSLCTGCQVALSTDATHGADTDSLRDGAIVTMVLPPCLRHCVAWC
jgi:hypothetical protein